MSGRGDGRLIRPKADALVKVGISISTSSPVLDPDSTSPFYVVITARILTSPRPDTPVTLMAFLNPFQSLPNRSIGNFKCISPESSSHKRIEIYPRSWPLYHRGSKDLRQEWPFVTVSADMPLVVEHEVPQSKIQEAGLQMGEKYVVDLTNRALGTRWWKFGALDDFDGVEFHHRESEDASSDEDDENEDSNFDEINSKANKGVVQSTMGEDPSELALVIENGQAEIEII